MSLKLGISTPSNLWSLEYEQRQATLARIQEAGFDHLFMADHVSFRNGSGTDGFVEVAALSQLNPKLGVMISIYLLPLRHPLPVARQLATMARIAPGRMIFGVGIGGEDRHEIEVCGVDPKTRGLRANESLDIIKDLLAGNEVSFQGEIFNIEAARIRPSPKTPIPIIVGGRSNAALARTARYGDGWIGVWCSTSRYAEALAQIDNECAKAERNPPEWLHGYQTWLGIDANEDIARTAVAKAMESFYHIPFDRFERYTPYGTPEQVAEQLAPYAEKGCRLFNLKVVTHDPADEVDLGAATKAHLEKLVG